MVELINIFSALWLLRIWAKKT